MTELFDGGRFCWPYSPESLVKSVFSFFRRNGTTMGVEGWGVEGWGVDFFQFPFSAASRLIETGLVSMRALGTEVRSMVIEFPGWSIVFVYVIVLVVLGTIRELYGCPHEVRSLARHRLTRAGNRVGTRMKRITNRL